MYRPTGVDASNYLANVSADTTASISPKALVIGITADDKSYDGTTSATTAAFVASGLLEGDVVMVSSANGLFDDKNVGTGKPVSANVSTSGSDAGNYSANATADTTASIIAKELEIGITADDKTYDGTVAAITTAFVAGGLAVGDVVTVTSTGGVFDNENVGTDKRVTADVSVSGTDAGNYVANATADTIASISPKEVSVSLAEPFLYIREGDPLPDIMFNYEGWIFGDAGNEGYTVLKDGIPYDATSDESAGIYIITPVPFNSNYIFAMETGVLHVNPYGPGTRAVRPVLNCIEEIETGYYLANFEYKNDNDVAVYIPVGADNFLTGSGIDWENSGVQPTMFEPGGGSFMVFFDGSELSWTVNSRDDNKKVSNAAKANSSSTKCQSNLKSAYVSTDIKEEELLDPDQLVAYPNPVADKLYISMKEIENYKMIVLYDFTGRSHPLTSIDQRSDQLEIDMGHLSSGHYLIRIVMEDSTRVVPIIKQ
ncbi:MAG: T9SS type A sorting domain-containing protein [Bacteroidales bacterium]|nr:T9SS type A sorting domain-containing protein [Bacteroidales bacterium]